MGHSVSDNQLGKIECYVATAFRPKKRTRLSDASPITLGYLTLKPGKYKNQYIKRMRILFDSGCEATLVNKAIVRKLPKIKGNTVNWSTKAGSFQTSEKCLINFKLPFLHEQKEITWTAYVEPSNQDEIKYDMIIGRDLMREIGIDIRFSDEKVIWDGAEIEMKHPDFLKEKRWVNLLEKELLMTHDPLTTDAERIQAIVDAKYAKQNPTKIIEGFEHLNREEKDKLISLLNKFQHLFDGGLGDWQAEPIELEVKEGSTPYHARPYPVPQAHEKQLKEEVDRLVSYGI